MKISLQRARRIALNSQLLDGRTRLPSGKEGVAQIIERLGYIQIDTIAVIQRAHHHTLWNRRPDYTPDMLHDLQAKDRRLFEYWGHAASYLPISDYRYYLPRMRGFDEPHNKWEKQRLEKFGHLMKPVLKRIREEGPLSSKDFAQPPGKKRGTWWDWRPMKVALELLFWRGELMITERRNFVRFYDLSERVLPVGTNREMPDSDELGQFLVRRALAAYGVAREGEIRKHLHGAGKEVVAKALHDLIDSGEVICVKIDKQSDVDFYALLKTIETSAKLRMKSSPVFLLSPFDNLIIQRERTKWLFDFDYVLECYLPAPKRKHGYFVLPILWGEELVGRLDPKAERKTGTLIIRNLEMEKAFNQHESLFPLLAERLWELAHFNQCEQITIERTSPKKFKPSLEHHIKKSAR